MLASRGLGGQLANGPSTQPSLDGTSRVAPHCVAFVSAASNLVRGDTNCKPDAFVYDPRSGRLRRVSLNSRGRQSSGTVSEVAVNGLCMRVAFVSDAGNLSSGDGNGVSDVYQRVMARATGRSATTVAPSSWR